MRLLSRIINNCQSHWRPLSTSSTCLEQIVNIQDVKDFESEVVKSRDPVIVETVIGLEVHAQLTTKSKLFSQGPSDRKASSNSQLDLLDVAIPGSLPKLNRAAIIAAITTGLGLNCSIQDRIHFDRKNYFYTDMPAGYQITQNSQPIALEGYIDFIVTDHNKLFLQNYPHTLHYDKVRQLFYEDWKQGSEFEPYIKRSRVKQLQLEQDSAKTLNQVTSDQVELNNLVDYTRSGAALIEIVFEPDLTRPDEASSLVKELIMILRMLRTCDCKLQEGSLRVDANVSIKSIDGQLVPCTHNNRVELKNLNSLRSLHKGISYEIQRQTTQILSGKQVIQESRSFDLKTGRTSVLRLKETAVDYRYMPDPNLPPLRIEESLVEQIKKDFVVNTILPDKMRKILQEKYKVELGLISDLLDVPGLATYFMAIMDSDNSFDPNVVADFLFYAVSNLKNIGNLPLEIDLDDDQSSFMVKLSPNKMNLLLKMVFNEEISFASAYEVMKCLLTSTSESCPRELVEQFGWYQINDDAEIQRLCSGIIGNMKGPAKRYKKRGEKKVLGYMLDKLNELHDNRVNVKKAIECLNSRLRPEPTTKSK